MNSSLVSALSAELPSRSCISSQTSKERITSWHGHLLQARSASCQPLLVDPQPPALSDRRCCRQEHNWCSRPFQSLSCLRAMSRNSCKDLQWPRRRASHALVGFLGLCSTGRHLLAVPWLLPWREMLSGSWLFLTPIPQHSLLHSKFTNSTSIVQNSSLLLSIRLTQITMKHVLHACAKDWDKSGFALRHCFTRKKTNQQTQSRPHAKLGLIAN